MKCKKCDAELTGRKRKFCCNKCKMAFYSKENYELIKKIKKNGKEKI